MVSTKKAVNLTHSLSLRCRKKVIPVEFGHDFSSVTTPPPRRVEIKPKRVISLIFALRLRNIALTKIIFSDNIKKYVIM